MFASLLLIAAITMSWTVAPLNTKPLIWEEVASELPDFKPTDRLYFVNHDRGPVRTIEGFKTRTEIVEGPRTYLNTRYGYEESPGLKLHGNKSFTQKNVSEFVYHIFNGDGVARLAQMREITQGPLFFSDLLDMGAVSHYYTRLELQNVPDNLSLIYKSKWLYIYKNLNAWPYFYLAKRLDVKEQGKHLKNVKRGTAYLAEEDLFKLPEDAGGSNIQLKEFSFGKMIFDFHGDNEEFLVIADAWHPFWGASVGNEKLPVVKANDIFKGIRLPPGEYTLTLLFDTSPYMVGVYISVVSWVIFICGVLWAYSILKFRTRELA